MAKRLLFAALFVLGCVGGASAEGWHMAIPADRAVPSLEMGLQIIAEAARQGVLHPQDLESDPRIVVHEQHVVVIVEAESAWVPQALAQLGASVRHTAPEQGLWEILVSPEQLIDLARLPGCVVRALPPSTAPGRSGGATTPNGKATDG